MPKRTCSVEDCDKPHDSHGYCRKHADRLRKYGDPHGPSDDLIEPLPGERWLPVVGWPAYEVSDHGRIRSLTRTIVRSDGIEQRWAGRLLKPIVDSGGYLSIGTYAEETAHRLRVHTCVLEAFVGPRPTGMQARHLNGNPQDNRLENLAWGTAVENGLDRTRHGTNPTHTQERCKRNHRLEEPNLVPGYWKCLACNKATRHANDVRRWQGVEVDLDAVADRFYEHILTGAPLPTVRTGKPGRPRLTF